MILNIPGGNGVDPPLILCPWLYRSQDGPFLVFPPNLLIVSQLTTSLSRGLATQPPQAGLSCHPIQLRPNASASLILLSLSLSLSLFLFLFRLDGSTAKLCLFQVLPLEK
ncbi:hypothetical protein IE53DRAFT_118562 [Violaceomyces palustris]|uniref:Uncharacterized protein n=1 Tax=Violaceomyces palustris TaxID=1673888 RepID=A0ACD0NVT1_9BASI|nr:hypothetical protein IE53DRAFT_118562 [Violaceomyces palustris]